MSEFKCYTKQGHWKFHANDPQDALRRALYFCWRDGEDFIRIESDVLGDRYALRVVLVGPDGSVQTL